MIKKESIWLFVRDPQPNRSHKRDLKSLHIEADERVRVHIFQFLKFKPYIYGRKNIIFNPTVNI